jgi:hypothetical protein
MPRNSYDSYREDLRSLLADASLDWLVAISVRMALRALPFAIGTSRIDSGAMLAMFRLTLHQCPY